ncbi:hypothetical protein ACX1C1_03890 [Paenibacillus sp. strain BS8-2]
MSGIARCSGLVFVILLLLLNSKSSDNFSNRLYTPTYITKINSTYFIVDCWNHRIIYSSDLNKGIQEWNTLDDDIIEPHSIASDGELYLAENTGGSQLFVYKEDSTGFVRTQVIENVNGRPHKTVYDNATEKFYVLTAESQDMYILSNVNGEMILDEVVDLEFLQGGYTRSFSIIDNKMYFVSGPHKVIVADFIDGNISVDTQYDVPEEYWAMNGIHKIDEYFYISIYPENLIRVKNLSMFEEAENVYNELTLKGTPYYFSSFDGRFFLTEIDSSSGIKAFNVENGSIVNVETINDSGPPDKAVMSRKSGKIS